MVSEGSYYKCQSCWKCSGFSLMKRKGLGILEMENNLTKYTEDNPGRIYVETHDLNRNRFE